MKLVDGFYYPDAEERLWRGHARFQDIEEHILPNCPKRRTAVQAGGAVGVWVQKLCEHFEHVVTFEPNELQRSCMGSNVTATNYECHPAALWRESGEGRIIEVQDNNLGAWRVEPDEGGPIELMTVDSLGLENVDLLCLDIEGAEYEALEGAKETIRRWKPVIVVETKWITLQAYKRKPEELQKKVASFGYKRHSKFGRDELWLPIA